MAEMSLRAYARHRGVALSAVQKAITSGRIQKTATGRIDPDAADRGWARNTEPLQQRNGVTGGRPEKPYAESIRRSFGAPSGGDSASSSLAASQSVRIAYQARLAKLEYEERLGKLVSADDVRAAAFRSGREVRDRILRMPDGLAPLLVGVTLEDAHRILTNEVDRILHDIASLGKLPGPGGDVAERGGGL